MQKIIMLEQPAPLNQKDLCDDAIFDEIFDSGNWNYVGKNYVVGGIKNVPYMVRWSFGSNTIEFIAIEPNADPSAVEEVIKKYVDDVNKGRDDTGLFARSVSNGERIYAMSFYWDMKHFE